MLKDPFLLSLKEDSVKLSKIKKEIDEAYVKDRNSGKTTADIEKYRLNYRIQPNSEHHQFPIIGTLTQLVVKKGSWFGTLIVQCLENYRVLMQVNGCKVDHPLVKIAKKHSGWTEKDQVLLSYPVIEFPKNSTRKEISPYFKYERFIRLFVESKVNNKETELKFIENSFDRTFTSKISYYNDETKREELKQNSETEIRIKRALGCPTQYDQFPFWSFNLLSHDGLIFNQKHNKLITFEFKGKSSYTKNLEEKIKRTKKEYNFFILADDRFDDALLSNGYYESNQNGELKRQELQKKIQEITNHMIENEIYYLDLTFDKLKEAKGSIMKNSSIERTFTDIIAKNGGYSVKCEQNNRILDIYKTESGFIAIHDDKISSERKSRNSKSFEFFDKINNKTHCFNVKNIISQIKKTIGNPDWTIQDSKNLSKLYKKISLSSISKVLNKKIKKNKSIVIVKPINDEKEIALRISKEFSSVMEKINIVSKEKEIRNLFIAAEAGNEIALEKIRELTK